MSELALQASTLAESSPGSSTAINVPYGASMASDIAAFEGSMRAAAGDDVALVDGVSKLAKAVFEPLDFLNKEAMALGDYARSALDAGASMTPAEIINLTVQSQKFMFHSQLTANIANRTADGVQQLFRQQG